jgi:hypothetical protein
LATAEADVRRRYMAGQISSAEYRTALTELGARERVILQINAENARHGASMGSASAERALQREALAQARIGEGKATPEQIRAMSAGDRQIYYEQQALRNPQRADVVGLSPLATGLGRRVDALRAELDAFPNPPSETIGWPVSRPNPAFAEYQQRRARTQTEYDFALRNYQSAVGTQTAPRVNGPRVSGAGTTPPPPSGFGILP